MVIVRGFAAPQDVFAIRSIATSDVEAVARVLSECGLMALHPDGGTFIWVSEGKAGVVGCAAIEVDGHSALVRSLGILAPFRNSGLGRGLMRRLIAEALSMGIQDLYLFTNRAPRYYLRMGWREVAVRCAAEAVFRTRQVSEFEKSGWDPTMQAFHLVADFEKGNGAGV